MKKKVILLISGKRRGGKSTLADYLRGYNYQKLGFADPLYSLYNQIWLNSVQLTQEHGDLSRVVRERLIDLGAALRCVHSDAVVRIAAKRIRGMVEREEIYRFVLPNYRFPNELKIGDYASLQNGADFVVRTIRIERKGHVLLDGLDNDMTETALDDAEFDYTISVDNGDLDTIAAEARRIAQEIEKEVN